MLNQSEPTWTKLNRTANVFGRSKSRLKPSSLLSNTNLGIGNIKSLVIWLHKYESYWNAILTPHITSSRQLTCKMGGDVCVCVYFFSFVFNLMGWIMSDRSRYFATLINFFWWFARNSYVDCSCSRMSFLNLPFPVFPDSGQDWKLVCHSVICTRQYKRPENAACQNVMQYMYSITEKQLKIKSNSKVGLRTKLKSTNSKMEIRLNNSPAF